MFDYMIKVFFRYEKDLSGYWSVTQDCTCEKQGFLKLLLTYLDISCNQQVVMEIHNNKACFWFGFLEEDFDTWEEIPKLIMSKKIMTKCYKLGIKM